MLYDRMFGLVLPFEVQFVDLADPDTAISVLRQQTQSGDIILDPR